MIKFLAFSCLLVVVTFCSSQKISVPVQYLECNGGKHPEPSAEIRGIPGQRGLKGEQGIPCDSYEEFEERSRKYNNRLKSIQKGFTSTNDENVQIQLEWNQTIAGFNGAVEFLRKDINETLAPFQQAAHDAEILTQSLTEMQAALDSTIAMMNMVEQFTTGLQYHFPNLAHHETSNQAQAIKSFTRSMVDIVFVLDGASVSNEDFLLMLDWIALVGHSFIESIGDNLRIGIIQSSRYSDVAVPLTTFQSTYDFDLTVGEIVQDRRVSNDRDAIEKAHEHFMAQKPNETAYYQNVMILLTDESIQSDGRLRYGANNSLHDEVKLFVVGIAQADDEQLQIIANGDTDRVFNVKSFRLLHNITDQLGTKIIASLEDGVKIRSCKDVPRIYGGRKNGRYTIQPNESVQPFTVSCRFDENPNLLSYGDWFLFRERTYNQTETLVEYEWPDCTITRCPTQPITYEASAAQMRALIEYVGNCRQFVYYGCVEAVLFESEFQQDYVVGWDNWNGTTRHYWGGAGGREGYCACGVDGTCVDPTKKCNCDSNDSQRQSDEGYLTQQDDIPVTKFYFGYYALRDSRNYDIGPLQCIED